MHLPDGEGELSSQRLDVGLVLVREYEENKQWIAEIAEKHFFVPPALGGSGIIGRQLDGSRESLRHGHRPAVRCDQDRVRRPAPATSPAAKQPGSNASGKSSSSRAARLNRTRSRPVVAFDVGIGLVHEAAQAKRERLRLARVAAPYFCLSRLAEPVVAVVGDLQRA